MVPRLTPVKAMRLRNVVEPKYPQSYLDEYIFGHKRRRTPMAAVQANLVISDIKRH